MRDVIEQLKTGLLYAAAYATLALMAASLAVLAWNERVYIGQVLLFVLGVLATIIWLSYVIWSATPKLFRRKKW